MKRALLLSAAAITFFANQAYADSSKGMMMRGGLGFLFPDNNSFANPGQFAETSGVALQGSYERVATLDDQTAGASLVWGNGRFGLGGFASRTGTELGKSNLSTDYAGGGLGVSLIKDRLSIGGGYSKNLESNSTDDGTVNATMTLSGAKGQGFSMGISGTSVLNSDDGDSHQTGTVAIGYAFKHNVSIEADYTVTDFDHASDDYIVGGYVNLANPIVYLSAGYQWLNAIQKHRALARLGFVVTRRFDFSVLASHIFYTGSNPSYGGTIRIVF